MKQCTLCRKELPLSEFNRNSKRKDGLANTCRPCNKERSKRYYLENKDKHIKVTRARRISQTKIAQQNILLYLGSHHCVDCGESDPIVLEFDHIKGKKRNNISSMISSGYHWNAILEEIEKCEVRCANCHRRKTYSDLNSYRVLGLKH